MRIDSANKAIQPLTEESPPAKSNSPAPLEQDTIVSAPSEENSFTKLTTGEQAVSEGNSEWNDVAEKVVTGVGADVGLVVGAFTLGPTSAAAIPAAASEAGFGAMPFATPEFAIAASSIASTALTIAAITDFSDVSNALSDAAGAVADAVGDAASAVADTISDVCNW